ncbi:MAG TPA: hypothetical protein VF950_19905 [Planctomycetota bacterium]
MSYGDLRKVWRIVAAIVAAQLLGFGIGLAFGSFESVWIGGALASLPGSLAGTYWHVRAAGRRDLSTAAFLNAGALVLAVVAGGFFLPRLLWERAYIAEMARLQTADVRRIEVNLLRESGPSLALEGEAIEAFTRSCADVEKYSPNHPRYERSWHLVLEGPKRREVELHLMASDPSRVFGSFVETSGATTWYCGSFQSRALRAWVDRYLLR